MSIIDKIKSMLKGHEDTVRKAVDMAGDAFDQKTGNKYQKQVDQAQEKIDEQLGASADRPGQDKKQGKS
jgi:MT0933-like antitoxin protein